MCGGKGGSGGGTSPTFSQPSPITTNQAVNQATQQQQQYTADPRIQAAIEQSLFQGQNAAWTPFSLQPQQIAGFTPMQQQAFGQLGSIQGMTDPYFAQARNFMGQGAGLIGQGAGVIGQGTGLIGQGAAGAGAGQNIMSQGFGNLTAAGTPLTQGDISQYMNPFADQALANMKKYVFDPQRVQTMGQQTQMAGGVGADRLALASQNLDKTQADAIAQAQAGFYGNAAQIAQQQKQQALAAGMGWGQLGQGYGGLGLGIGGLGSQMGGLGVGLGGLGSQMGNLGVGYGGLGTSAQNAALGATGALLGAGNLQQQNQQAALNAQYQNRLMAQAYPFQSAQFLAGLAGGLAPALGGTTTGAGYTAGAGLGAQMPSQPAYGSQLFGGLLGGAGVLGSLGAFNNWGSGKGSAPTGPIDLNFDTSGLGGGNTFYYGRGGRAFQTGGAVSDDPIESVDESDDPIDYSINKTPFAIPQINLPIGRSGEATGAKLDLNPTDDIQFPLPWTMKQDQQQGQSGGGGGGSSFGVGDAVKIATTVLPFILSDRRFKTDITKLGQDENSGLDMYAYRYKGDPKTYPKVVGPMAQDVQKMQRARGGRTPMQTGGNPTGTPLTPEQANDPAVAATYPDYNTWINDGGTNDAWHAFTRNRRSYLAVPSPFTPQETPLPQPAGPELQPEPQPVPQPSQPIKMPVVGSPDNPFLKPELFKSLSGGSFAPPAIGPPSVGVPKIGKSAGGSVNPFDIGQPFQFGGASDDDEEIDASDIMLENQGLGQKPDWSPMQEKAPEMVAAGATPTDFDLGEEPGITTQLSAAPRSQYPQSPFAPTVNRDMTMESMMIPRSQMPYPDATERDWGQRAARSPWMALIAAGARMAGSTKPLGSAITEGLAAGAGQLESQRKALQTEEQINQRAQGLFETAKRHLDRYQRKTPHDIAVERHQLATEQRQQEALEQGRYTYVGTDEDGYPILLNRKTGETTRASTKFAPATGGTALQKNANWLVSNGIAPDLKTAYEMVRTGINQPAVYARLVEAAKNTLLKTGEGMGMNPQQLENAAREQIKERFGISSPSGAASTGKPTPTQADIDYVKAHPEARERFKQRFGIEPP